MTRPSQHVQTAVSPPLNGNRGAATLDAYRFSAQVGHLLRRAYQRHLMIFQENSGHPEITSVQFATLCALQELGPSSQAALVQKTAIVVVEHAAALTMGMTVVDLLGVTGRPANAFWVDGADPAGIKETLRRSLRRYGHR